MGRKPQTVAAQLECTSLGSQQLVVVAERQNQLYYKKAICQQDIRYMLLANSCLIIASRTYCLIC